VQTERTFSIVLPDTDSAEHLWTGAIDRLVLEPDDVTPIAAEVIDYKTDRVAADELDARVDYYRPQPESYRRVVSAITGLEEARIRARLLFLTLGRIVEIGD
jgi:ATP-dependent exoDNAse (exonuclease V) beta subunit